MCQSMTASYLWVQFSLFIYTWFPGTTPPQNPTSIQHLSLTLFIFSRKLPTVVVGGREFLQNTECVLLMAQLFGRLCKISNSAKLQKGSPNIHKMVHILQIATRKQMYGGLTWSEYNLLHHVYICFSEHEQAVSYKCCNLIGSGSRQNFLILLTVNRILAWWAKLL